MEGGLYVHKVGEDTQGGGGCDEHDEDPEVELGIGPMVAAAALNDPY